MKYILLICCAAIVACNDNNDGADSTSTVQRDTTSVINIPSCYTLQTSNNLVLLKLNSVSPTVSGQLTYEIMGKDKNDGTISGSMRGDTLFADYSFMSEGIQSVREVVFLKRGDTFVEGYGEVEQQGNSMVFTNTDSLNFGGSMILKEVPCTRE